VSVAVRELLRGGAMAEARITSYTPHNDTAPGAEVAALAALYRFVLDCRSRKEATRPGSPDAAKEIKNDSRPKHHSR
jgi:hypothetical protein